MNSTRSTVSERFEPTFAGNVTPCPFVNVRVSLPTRTVTDERLVDFTPRTRTVWMNVPWSPAGLSPQLSR